MTWQETGVNNATIHNFPDSPYIVKTELNLKHDKKIFPNLQFCFKNETAARDYLQRQGLENLPVKVFIHKG